MRGNGFFWHAARADVFLARSSPGIRLQEPKGKGKGQLSFFDAGLSGNGFQKTANNLPQIKEWPEPQLLAFEKDMLGFYVSGHPLASYAAQLKRFSSFSTINLSGCEDGSEIKIVGFIAKIKQTLTRARQEKMAILKLED